MATPTPKELCDAAGISVSYANKLLLDGEHRRVPPLSLAIHLYRKTGWKHPEALADLSDEQIALLEQVQPWTPPKERQDEAA
jgi:hypothetical protein